MNSRAGKWTWIIIAAAIIVLCAALVCCLLIILASAILFFQSSGTVVPETQIFPTVPLISTIPAQSGPVVVTVAPTVPPPVGPAPGLDAGADPLFGLTNLQRGMSPDPYIIAVGAGGTVDKASMGLACGFTTSSPTFRFTLSGGASEGFLRIFYMTSDDTDTTLVVRTPDQQWLCADDSPYGIAPVIDIEYAPSGQYNVWVGTHQRDLYGTGRLFVTQSEANTP